MNQANSKNIADFNHLILYSKGWYKHTDFLEDVRIIMAERCGLGKEHMSNSDIWNLLVHISEKYLRQHERTEIFTSMFSASWIDEPSTGMFCKWQGQTSWIRPAKMIVSKLQNLTVKDVLNIGKPDPKILPVIDDMEEKWKAIHES
jgi:hypothetical protein